MARVVLEHLTKHFFARGHPMVAAVEDVNLTVADGELLVLLGPSGAGKSTVLRLLAGLEEPTRGTMAINGVVVNDLSPKDRDLALVLQHPALLPHLTARANLGFGLKLRRFPPAEIAARTLAAADRLHLRDCLDRLPRALSGGERQRVAIARALVRQPRVLLLDEPLAHLDAALRRQLRGELARLHHQLGTTMIYVTHDQAEAMTLADRIAVLRAGTLQQVGAPLEIYQRPANVFVAGFLGSPPMNLIPGRLGARHGALDFIAPAHSETTEGLVLRLPASHAQRLQPWADRDLVLGLRPEHLALSAADSPPQRGFTAVVQRVEPLGAETLVSVAWGATELAARVSPTWTGRPGQRLPLAFTLEAANYFDAATGTAI